MANGNEDRRPEIVLRAIENVDVKSMVNERYKHLFFSFFSVLKWIAENYAKTLLWIKRNLIRFRPDKTGEFGNVLVWINRLSFH